MFRGVEIGKEYGLGKLKVKGGVGELEKGKEDMWMNIG